MAAYRHLLELTRDTYPELRSWVQAHPLAALAQAADWGRLLSVVRWIVDHGGPGVYLRQVDVPGVDTKLIETHRGLLGELLDTVLPQERVDSAVPYRRFAERYRLATKPTYVRCRSLDHRPLLPAPSDTVARPATPNRTGLTELTLRLHEAAQFPLPGSRIVIVENEITYLALPAIPDALAVLGGGYGLTAVAALTWLREREVHYWGDLDTHGFAILDRLRTILPTVRSFLMNRTTLEEHRDHWGHEPTPVTARLEHLTEPEHALYTDLVEDRYAPGRSGWSRSGSASASCATPLTIFGDRSSERSPAKRASAHPRETDHNPAEDPEARAVGLSAKGP